MDHDARQIQLIGNPYYQRGVRGCQICIKMKQKFLQYIHATSWQYKAPAVYQWNITRKLLSALLHKDIQYLVFNFVFWFNCEALKSTLWSSENRLAMCWLR